MYPENTPHTSTFSNCRCPQECRRSSHAARPVMARKWKPATPHQGTKTLRVIHAVKSCTMVVMNGLDPHVSRWINIKKINLSKKNPICKRICVIYRHTHINSKSKKHEWRWHRLQISDTYGCRDGAGCRWGITCICNGLFFFLFLLK